MLIIMRIVDPYSDNYDHNVTRVIMKLKVKLSYFLLIKKCETEICQYSHSDSYCNAISCIRFGIRFNELHCDSP